MNRLTRLIRSPAGEYKVPLPACFFPHGLVIDTLFLLARLCISFPPPAFCPPRAQTSFELGENTPRQRIVTSLPRFETTENCVLAVIMLLF